MGGDKLTLSLTILLTGFAVVFAVLLILIGIIKLYGTIIYRIQTKARNKKVMEPVESSEEPAPVNAPVAVIEADDEVDDDELIAVISAAVYAVCSSSQVRIKSIRKSHTRSDAWRSAGLRDNLRPF